MKFYDIDNALDEAIAAAEKLVKVKIEIELDGHYQSVFEQDIIEANFYSIKEAAGGVTSRGEIVIDNSCGFFSTCGGTGAGLKVKVSFSIGEGLTYFYRFLFYVDYKGIQDIKGSGRKKVVHLGLRDLSAKLKKSDQAKDWSSAAVFVYSVICDKTQPVKSLVHRIAKRGGLESEDIDCATVPVTIPFVVLKGNVWAELSSIATAYRCHLECAVEKPLVFIYSPYQSEPLAEKECSYTLHGNEIFYLRKIEKSEYYMNTVRIKVNMPVELERQEIWRYNEPPIFYDDFYQPYYPFKYPLVREIEVCKYEAVYSVIDVDGKERPVIFADHIDSKNQAENRLEYDGGKFSYSHYDVFTNYNKAVLTLEKENDSDLYNASIFGRPIVRDINRSYFLNDEEEVAANGTLAVNVTNSYFSDYIVPDSLSDTMQGKRQYEDWVHRELADRIHRKKEITVKTHKALFHARVGAKIKINLRNEEISGEINSFSLRYRRDRALITTLKILENREENNIEEI